MIRILPILVLFNVFSIAALYFAKSYEPYSETELEASYLETSLSSNNEKKDISPHFLLEPPFISLNSKYEEMIQNQVYLCAVEDRADLKEKKVSMQINQEAVSINEKQRFTCSLLNESYSAWVELDAGSVFLSLQEPLSNKPIGRFKLKRPDDKENEKIGFCSLDKHVLENLGIEYLGIDLFLQDVQDSKGQLFRWALRSASSVEVQYLDKESLYAFIQERWVKEANTQGYPLLKIDQAQHTHLLTTIWNASGNKKVTCELKSDIQPIQFTREPLYFVGLKSPEKRMIKDSKKRWVVQKESIWLIKNGEIQPINDIELLNQVLENPFLGELFIVQQFAKTKRGMQIIGTLYNKGRNLKQRKTIDLPAL